MFYKCSWAKARHSELRARGSSLEFKLHRLVFLDLMREGRQQDALIYSRNFSPFAPDHAKGTVAQNKLLFSHCSHTWLDYEVRSPG